MDNERLAPLVRLVGQIRKVAERQGPRQGESWDERRLRVAGATLELLDRWLQEAALKEEDELRAAEEEESQAAQASVPCHEPFEGRDRT
jgi:hypothetical protein